MYMLVGCYLATIVFNKQIASYGRGVDDHRVGQQISCSYHAPQLRSCNYYMYYNYIINTFYSSKCRYNNIVFCHFNITQGSRGPRGLKGLTGAQGSKGDTGKWGGEGDIGLPGPKVS